MRQHPIPQNILDIEFKLFTKFTIREFAYMAIGIGFGGIFLYLFSKGEIPAVIALPVFLISSGIGLFLGLVPINDQNADVFMRNYFLAISRPTQRVWKGELFDEKVQVIAQQKGVSLGTTGTMDRDANLKSNSKVIGGTAKNLPTTQFIEEETLSEIEEDEAEQLELIDQIAKQQFVMNAGDDLSTSPTKSTDTREMTSSTQAVNPSEEKGSSGAVLSDDAVPSSGTLPSDDTVPSAEATNTVEATNPSDTTNLTVVTDRPQTTSSSETTNFKTVEESANPTDAIEPQVAKFTDELAPRTELEFTSPDQETPATNNLDDGGFSTQNNSHRSDKPLVSVNNPSLSPEAIPASLDNPSLSPGAPYRSEYNPPTSVDNPLDQIKPVPTVQNIRSEHVDKVPATGGSIQENDLITITSETAKPVATQVEDYPEDPGNIAMYLTNTNGDPIPQAMTLIKDSAGSILQVIQSDPQGLVLPNKKFVKGKYLAEIKHDNAHFPRVNFILDGNKLPVVNITSIN